jgi:hypothetical protein
LHSRSGMPWWHAAAILGRSVCGGDAERVEAKMEFF